MDWHLRFSQQASWTAELRAYIFRKIGLRPPARLLEVGCGTGAVLSTIESTMEADRPDEGRAAPISIYGLDIDWNFLCSARRHAPGAALIQGDARALPFEVASFDLVFCHFLLLWIDQPLAVLQQFRRLTRPGGWVAAFAEPDYGGRIDYPEDFSELGRMQEQRLRQQGAEPRFGRQLSALFHMSGLSEIECGLLGAQWSGRPSAGELKIEWDVMLEDLQGLLEPSRLESLRIANQEAWEAGQRILYVPTFYAFGRVLD